MSERSVAHPHVAFASNAATRRTARHRLLLFAHYNGSRKQMGTSRPQANRDNTRYPSERHAIYMPCLSRVIFAHTQPGGTNPPNVQHWVATIEDARNSSLLP